VTIEILLHFCSCKDLNIMNKKKIITIHLTNLMNKDKIKIDIPIIVKTDLIPEEVEAVVEIVEVAEADLMKEVDKIDLVKEIKEIEEEDLVKEDEEVEEADSVKEIKEIGEDLEKEGEEGEEVDLNKEEIQDLILEEGMAKEISKKDKIKMMEMDIINKEISTETEMMKIRKECQRL